MKRLVVVWVCVVNSWVSGCLVGWLMRWLIVLRLSALLCWLMSLCVGYLMCFVDWLVVREIYYISFMYWVICVVGWLILCLCVSFFSPFLMPSFLLPSCISISSILSPSLSLSPFPFSHIPYPLHIHFSSVFPPPFFLSSPSPLVLSL